MKCSPTRTQGILLRDELAACSCRPRRRGLYARNDPRASRENGSTTSTDKSTRKHFLMYVYRAGQTDDGTPLASRAKSANQILCVDRRQIRRREIEMRFRGEIHQRQRFCFMSQAQGRKGHPLYYSGCLRPRGNTISSRIWYSRVRMR